MVDAPCGCREPYQVWASRHTVAGAALEGALGSGMLSGAIETWDRLAAVLAEG
jgi:hypothetical protein